MYNASSLGRTLSVANFTGWPATCEFGMLIPMSTDAEVYNGGGTFFVQPASTSSALQTTSLYITTIAGPTQPPLPTMSPTSIQTNHGLSSGATAGITTCAILAVALIVGAAYWIKTMQQKITAQHARLARMEELNDTGKAAFPIMSTIQGMTSSSPGAGSMMQNSSHASEAAVEMSPVSVEQEYEFGVHEMPGK